MYDGLTQLHWIAGGPPWPHVAIVLLLILGTRSHSVLCIIAIIMACGLATLHARGLRCVNISIMIVGGFSSE